MYDVRADGAGEVAKAIACSNPELVEPLDGGVRVVLPELDDWAWRYPNRIEDVADLAEHAGAIERELRENPESLQYLFADPARVLQDLGLHLSHRVALQLRQDLMVTAADTDQYAGLKAGAKGVGFAALEMRDTGDWVVARRSSSQRSDNPIGDFHTVLELSQANIERAIQLIYDEQNDFFPRRIPLHVRVTLPGDEIKLDSVALGRPTVIKVLNDLPPILEVHTAGGLVDSVTATSVPGKVVAHMRATMDEGKLRLQVEKLVSLSLEGYGDKTQEYAQYLDLIRSFFDETFQPLDLGSLVFGLAATEFAIRGQAGNSVQACINYSENGEADIEKVQSFMPDDWALGISEAFAVDRFQTWWNGDGLKYRRISRSKLGQLSTLEDPNEIFDPNGSIRFDDLRFQFNEGDFDFALDLTAINVFLWFDVHATIEAKVALSVNPATGRIRTQILSYDIKLPCWVKLFAGTLSSFSGIIASALVGGIIRLVAQSSPGSSSSTNSGFMGADIGSSVASAAKSAASQSTVAPGSFLPEVDLPTFGWQVPGTELTLMPRPKWLTTKKGELLVGGSLYLPPPQDVELQLSVTYLQSDYTPVVLPWEPDGGTERFLVTSDIRVSMVPGDLLLSPLRGTWMLDGKPMIGQGLSLRIKLEPSLSSCTVYEDINNVPTAKEVPCVRVHKRAWVEGGLTPIWSEFEEITAPKGPFIQVKLPTGSQLIGATTEKVGVAFDLKAAVTDAVGQSQTRVETFTPLVIDSPAKDLDAPLPKFLEKLIDFRSVIEGLGQDQIKLPPTVPPKRVAIVRSYRRPRGLRSYHSDSDGLATGGWPDP